MNDTILEMLQRFAEAAGFSEPKSIGAIVGSIIGSVLSFLGVIFLVLIIYGGYMYMTAMGSEEKVNKAKKIIVDASIGLVIGYHFVVLCHQLYSDRGIDKSNGDEVKSSLVRYCTYNVNLIQYC
ncbi:MAG: hypothetical protein ABIC82_03455 [bacterium]